MSVDGVKKKPFRDPIGRECLYALPNEQPYTGTDVNCTVQAKVKNTLQPCCANISPRTELFVFSVYIYMYTACHLW